MAQRDVTKPLTKEEKSVYIRNIAEIRKELGYEVGDDITYELLDKVLKYVNARITYEYDSENYGKTDFWNTQAFRWFVVDGYLLDDCDGSGYVFIGMALHVLKIHPKHVFRVSCATETNEGHFVCWVRASNGILYQIENRLRQPRTLRYMHDFGYKYWQYSDMSPANIRKDRWYNAENKVMKEIYKTPISAPGNEPTGSLATAIKNTAKSKTLTFGIFDKLLTTVGGVLGTLATVNDWKVAGLVVLYGLISLVVVYYIRSITYEPLEFKK
jgi:predicted transglutaminase-like cysteine proteinase